MQSTEYIIQLARERALFSFSSLIRPVVQDGENSIAAALLITRSSDAQKALWLADRFLKQDADLFRERFESVYRDYLDRAMQTMYRDLRMSLGEIDVDALTLIDDETVNREMEVDRLLLRLREANEDALSRISIIIAQIHGRKEVKERENPFRPYLIARSMHQVLLELVPAEAAAKVLFEHLSNALASRLSAYYEAIRTVFESRGIRAKLLAQPGRLVKHQRYAGGSFLEGDDQLRDNSPVETGFRNILGAIPQASGAETSWTTVESPEIGPSAQELQDFVRRIFSHLDEGDGQLSPNLTLSPITARVQLPKTLSRQVLEAASPKLLAQVDEFQQRAAQKGNAEPLANPQQFDLFDLDEPNDQTKKMERVTIDIVGMLFRYLLEDEQIPKEVREQISRLQIPFLKTAMMAPEVLQQAEHPARKLLNRMSSLTIGIDPESPVAKSLTDEMARIVEKILHDFRDDTAIFSTCLEELEAAVEKQLATPQSDIAHSVMSIEKAEQSSENFTVTVTSLHKFLQPLILDVRAFKFICEIWAKVLCQEALQSNTPGITQYHDLLPDLIWSIQEKQNPEERSALIRLLPDLVKQLKEGMLTIHLPESEGRQALDHFVALHMEVLRPSKSAPLRKLFTLNELRQYFSEFIVGQECNPSPFNDDGTSLAIAEESRVAEAPNDHAATIDALELHATALESALAEHGISSELDADPKAIPVFASDDDWMALMQLGICVERWSEGAFQMTHLAWISRNRTLYLFRDKQTDRPFVFSATSLLKALREGSVRMIEYAPAFDRAVDALISDAGSLQTHPARDNA